MPIRPEERKRYPPDWPEISARIRFGRAGRRCECTGECGQDHVGNGYWRGSVLVFSDRCTARHGQSHPITGSRVVLTVAHLDHMPENCADDNLKAMCQLCHNRMDAPHRRAGIRERAHAKAAIADLFAIPDLLKSVGDGAE